MIIEVLLGVVLLRVDSLGGLALTPAPVEQALVVRQARDHDPGRGLCVAVDLSEVVVGTVQVHRHHACVGRVGEVKAVLQRVHDECLRDAAGQDRGWHPHRVTAVKVSKVNPIQALVKTMNTPEEITATTRKDGYLADTEYCLASNYFTR